MAISGSRMNCKQRRDDRSDDPRHHRVPGPQLAHLFRAFRNHRGPRRQPLVYLADSGEIGVNLNPPSTGSTGSGGSTGPVPPPANTPPAPGSTGSGETAVPRLPGPASTARRLRRWGRPVSLRPRMSHARAHSFTIDLTRSPVPDAAGTTVAISVTLGSKPRRDSSRSPPGGAGSRSPALTLERFDHGAGFRIFADANARVATTRGTRTASLPHLLATEKVLTAGKGKDRACGRVPGRPGGGVRWPWPWHGPS